jgi:hypothetical protein
MSALPKERKMKRGVLISRVVAPGVIPWRKEMVRDLQSAVCKTAIGV